MPHLSLKAACFLLAVSVLLGRVEPTGDAALTILYTNDTRGYLQTCGCRHSGLGGLDRRATLVKNERGFVSKAFSQWRSILFPG